MTLALPIVQSLKKMGSRSRCQLLERIDSVLFGELAVLAHHSLKGCRVLADEHRNLKRRVKRLKANVAAVSHIFETAPTILFVASKKNPPKAAASATSLRAAVRIWRERQINFEGLAVGERPLSENRK